MLSLLLLVAARQQTVNADLIYAKFGGVALTMDEFKPAKPNGEAVLYMMSGGWYSDHSMINASFAKEFTDRGITLFEVVHGSQPRYKIPEMVAMIARAIRYVRYNATTLGVSPDKIGITGVSSGGHLSLMSGVVGAAGDANAKDPIDQVSSKPNAIVAFCPPTDMVNFGSPGRMPFKEAKYMVFTPAFPVAPTADVDELKKVAMQLSPIYGVSAAFPPTLLVSGDKDDLVPIEQSQRMDEALGKARVPHQFVTIPGAPHGVGGKPAGMSEETWLKTGAQAMFDWFAKYLK